MIANNEPRCKLTSISKEFDLNSYKDEIIIRCAEELIGRNSETPWIKAKINISIRSISIIYSFVT